MGGFTLFYKLAWIIVTRPFRTWGANRPVGVSSQVRGENFIIIPLDDYHKLKNQNDKT